VPGTDAGPASTLERQTLLGLDGHEVAISSLAGAKATVVVFIGNGCPTVRAYESRLIGLQANWLSHGVKVVAVNSNNPFLSPPDTVAEMVRRANSAGFNFLYLKDEDSRLAKRLGAICTPHAFVFDASLRLVYSGRIDDSRVGDKITTRDLENAVADVAAGRTPAVPRTDPFGCSIVW
jgi:thiol-disulfide isomerase/thioredoxin